MRPRPVREALQRWHAATVERDSHEPATAEHVEAAERALALRDEYERVAAAHAMRSFVTVLCQPVTDEAFAASVRDALLEHWPRTMKAWSWPELSRGFARDVTATLRRRWPLAVIVLRTKLDPDGRSVWDAVRDGWEA